jgi:hypothetical protein
MMGSGYGDKTSTVRIVVGVGIIEYTEKKTYRYRLGSGCICRGFSRLFGGGIANVLSLAFVIGINIAISYQLGTAIIKTVKVIFTIVCFVAISIRAKCFIIHGYDEDETTIAECWDKSHWRQSGILGWLRCFDQFDWCRCRILRWLRRDRGRCRILGWLHRNGWLRRDRSRCRILGWLHRYDDGYGLYGDRIVRIVGDVRYE